MPVHVRMSDRGQAAPLLAVLVVLAGGICLLVAQLGGAAIAQARARTAADAAALAGAVEGRTAAGDLATANGGTLEEFAVDGADTDVRVRVGDATAAARAEVVGSASGTDVGPPSGGRRAGLAPVMLAALARADALLGHPVRVVSGFRSHAEQVWLWEHRTTNPYPVAEPGTSMHERGLAIDVALPDVADLVRVATSAGLCQPLPTSDPVHFEPCQLTSPG